MNRTPHGSLLLVATLTLAACEPDFEVSIKRIDKMHVLAVQAEPPEIACAQEGGPTGLPDRARLTSLVAHPLHVSDGSHQSTLVHVACTPDPAVPAPDPCGQNDTIRDPVGLLGQATGLDCSALTAAEFGRGTVGGVSFAGVEECDAEGCRPARFADPERPDASVVFLAPGYVLPSELQMNTLPAGSPQRRAGLNVTILSIAVDAAPSELFSGPDTCRAIAGLPSRLRELMQQRYFIVASKSVRVRGPDSSDPPNRNPVLLGLTNRGVPCADLLTVEPGGVAELLPLLPAEPDRPRYAELDANGEWMSDKQERWVYSWFTTAGYIKWKRTSADDELQPWTAERDEQPLPAGERVRLYAVARDLRGGIAWHVQEVEVR